MGKCASKPSVEESALTERLTGITELLQQIQADQRKATTQDLDATTPVLSTLQQTPTQIAVLALRDAAIAAAEGGDAAADVRKLAKSAIDRVASLESKVEVAPPANATMAQAQTTCATLPDCLAITFHDLSSMAPTTPVKIYFKNNTHVMRAQSGPADCHHRIE